MLENIFKNLLIAQILLLILIFVKVMFEFTLLNEELYLISYNLPLPVPDIYAWVIFAIILIAFFAALYLLFNFKKIGRNIFLFLIIFGILVGFFMGPTIADPIDYLLEYLLAVADGAILVFIYFSPLKDKFE